MPAIRRRVDTSVDVSLELQSVELQQIEYKTGQQAEPAQGDAALTVAVAMASGANINITTFLESSEYADDRLQLQLVEGVVVVFILIAWMCAILMFVHRWHKLRILPPVDAAFKNPPKNLDKIKVVKRQTDSVIYRNYSRRMSKTIIAREKHLARMNTMPELQIHFGPKEKRLDRLKTMPIIELSDLGGLHMINSASSSIHSQKSGSSASSCHSISSEDRSVK